MNASAQYVVVRGGRRELVPSLEVPANSGAARYGEGALAVFRYGPLGPYLGHRHFERLEKSCAFLGFAAPNRFDLLDDLLALGLPERDQRVRLTVCDDGSGEPMRWMEVADVATAIVRPRCILVEGHATALPGAKTTSYAFSRFALRQALDANADDAIVFAGSNLIEGATSNLWLVKDGGVRLCVGRGALDGVTAGRLFELATDLGLNAFPAEDLSIDDLRAADEVWLTSAISGLRTVASVGDVTYGPAPVGDALRATYDEDRKADWGELPVVVREEAPARLQAAGFTVGDAEFVKNEASRRWALRTHHGRALWWQTHPDGGELLRNLLTAEGPPSA